MIKEVYAQGIKPPGPWSNKNPVESFGQLISLAFQVILVVAAIYAVLQIIFAGYGMISSGGDAKNLEAARGKIIWAIVGIIVIVASWGLIILAQILLGTCLGFGCPIDLSIQ